MIKRQFMVKARNLVQGQEIAQKWHSLQSAIVQKAAKLKALKSRRQTPNDRRSGGDDLILRSRQPHNPVLTTCKPPPKTPQ